MRRQILHAVVLILFCYNEAIAASLVLGSDTGEIRIGKYLEIYEDKTGQRALDEILALGHEFEPSAGAIPSFGLTRSAMWARLTLINPEPVRQTWFLSLGHAALDDARLFQPDPAGGYRTISLGDVQPFAFRPIAYRFPVFPIDLPADTSQTVYLRLQSEGTVSFDFVLRNPIGLVEQIHDDSYGQGLYFGVLVAMLLYNAFLFFSTRNPSFLFLSLYIFFRTATSLNAQGYLGEFLWPESPHLVNATYWPFAFFELTFAVLFTVYFLDTRRYAPWVHRLLMGAAVAFGLTALASPVLSYHHLATAHLTISPVLSLYALFVGILCWWRGSRAARFYVLAFALFNSTTFVWALGVVGFLSIGTIPPDVVFFASVVGYIFLSMGVGDHMRQLQVRLNEALTAQNEELEIKVEERTNDLAVALQKAEVASEAKSRFLSNVSHEIRSPLNSILGFSELLARERTIPSEHRRTLELVTTAGRHLLNLINDVLNISKIESGRLELNKGVASMHEVLLDVENIVRTQADDKGIELSFRSSLADDFNIEVDAGKLRQMLINLLTNAIKFTPEGRVTLDVAGDPTSSGDVLLTFDIIDTGQGIHPDEYDRVFGLFEQTRTGRESETGTGLGLSISREYARLMGGDITFTSVVGSGTHFVLTVIVSPVIREAGMLQARPEPVGLATGDDIRLLIVDDQPGNRLLLVSILEPLGFNLQQAKDGLEAIDLVGPFAPDLILMDINMPRMDGKEATRALRAQGKTLPIVALSASAFEDEISDIEACGVDRVLLKPIDRHLLLDTIAGQLELVYEFDQPDSVEEIIDLPATPALDAAAGLATCSNNAALYLRVLSDFRAGQSAADRAIANLVDMADTAGARLAAHSLRGMAGNIGARVVANQAATIEEQLAGGHIVDSAMLSELGNALEDALADMNAVIARLTDRVAAPAASVGEVDSLLSELRTLISQRDIRATEKIQQLIARCEMEGADSLKDKLEAVSASLGRYDYHSAESSL